MNFVYLFSMRDDLVLSSVFEGVTCNIISSKDVCEKPVKQRTLDTYPFVPIPNLVALFEPLPIIKSPVEVIGLSALNAAEAVVCPVPPLEIPTVPDKKDSMRLFGLFQFHAKA